MGKMIIKKEEIKKDIEISFNDNSIATGDLCFDDTFIKFNNGKLEIKIEGYTIIKSDILESYKLKREYLDKLLIK